MSAYSKTESGSVRRMFAHIAEHYDLLNRLMTLGLDRSWRKSTVQGLGLRGSERVADIGCGSGDLAFEVLKQAPRCRVIASDFTLEMIEVAKKREGAENIEWLVADAEALPFKADCCEACVSGFLMRNVPHLEQALSEQRRLLQSGGRIAALDTSPPARNLLKPFIDIYFRWIIPALGRLIAGDQAAYTYLPQSTQAFLKAEELAARFVSAGFSKVRFEKRMLGSVAIHWGRKE